MLSSSSSTLSSLLPPLLHFPPPPLPLPLLFLHLLLLLPLPPPPPPGRCSGCSASWSLPGSATWSSRRGRRSVQAGGRRWRAAADGWGGRRSVCSPYSCTDAPRRGSAPRDWWRNLQGHTQGGVNPQVHLQPRTGDMKINLLSDISSDYPERLYSWVFWVLGSFIKLFIIKHQNEHQLQINTGLNQVVTFKIWRFASCFVFTWSVWDEMSDKFFINTTFQGLNQQNRTTKFNLKCFASNLSWTISLIDRQWNFVTWYLWVWSSSHRSDRRSGWR